MSNKKPKLIKTDIENLSEGFELNAKGDLVSVSSITATTISATTSGLATIQIKAAGNYITLTTGTDGSWVTTGSGWVGGSNYTLSLGTPVFTGSGTPNMIPSTATVYNLGTDRVISLSLSAGLSNVSGAAVWSGTFTNIATAATNSVTITANVSAEAAGGPCFGAGTLVTKDGGAKVPIENIQVGDVLVAYSVPNRIDESDPTWVDWTTTAINDGFYTTSTVVSTNTHDVTEYYIINGSLVVTDDHRLLIYDASAHIWKWMIPSTISVGDFMYNETGAITMVSSSTFVNNDPITTYNLNVENIDTFMVDIAGTSIVAHNKF